MTGPFVSFQKYNLLNLWSIDYCLSEKLAYYPPEVVIFLLNIFGISLSLMN
jgi:hypothetical protein